MKNKVSSFPFRLNLLFFFIFILFLLLVLRLGFVQIVFGENFKREIARKDDITITNPVPRGKMLDRNFKVIVDNIPKNAISYTSEGAGQQDMLKTAENLAKLIEIKTDTLTVHDKKDFWLLKHPEQAAAKITKQEQTLYRSKKVTEKDIYQLKLKRVTPKDLNQLTSEDLKVLAIFREFKKSYKYTPQMVKNDGVTSKEFALVTEQLQSLPGVDTTTDWERSYRFGNTLKSVLGNVTDANEGIPADQLDIFLSKGYSRNDRVGKSYLELQYEDVLHGFKGKVKNSTDQVESIFNRNIISSGKRGSDLVLSIDMDLQLTVEKIIEEELLAAKKWPDTSLLDRAYVALMDPRTGEILTMAGKKMVKNKETGHIDLLDDALGTFTTTYNVGSTVKGATVLTGFKTGAITPNTFFDDQGLKIKGTPLKKSYAYLGTLNEIDALKKSSNVYMFHTAIQIGKGHYEYNQPLRLNEPHAFEIIRNSFASFGLGARTGIDLPNEQTGFKGTSRLPGFLLDLAIGQYDTYSAMQLVQYVSTIANGGYRMQPHLLKEIRQPIDNMGELGPLVMEMKPKVLNTIDVQKEWLDRVQTGFRKVMQDSEGTAYKFFGDAPYSPAGKTGTAQAYYDGPDRNRFGKEPPQVMNLSLVGYAPSQNPVIAMAVIVPWAYQGKDDHRANLKIGRRVMDAYFQLHKINH
ncbi:peptidoglycan D,D-transpeptidase FtsI family protein [Neobacillus sp. SM06]|uniref:peptidoglycan D,D-transpeptidase FtsI family protein n=1 Tax=Neobacillus sp. SM06 TaxID=3422492 RepID=UPI003D2B96B9